MRVVLEHRDDKGDMERIERKIASHKDYLPQVAGSAAPNFDVATLLLDEPVPLPFEPIRISNDPSLLTRGRALILVGYGKEKNHCPNGEVCSGKKLWMSGQVEGYHQTTRDRSCHCDSRTCRLRKQLGVARQVDLEV